MPSLSPCCCCRLLPSPRQRQTPTHIVSALLLLTMSARAQRPTRSLLLLSINLPPLPHMCIAPCVIPLHRVHLRGRQGGSRGRREESMLRREGLFLCTAAHSSAELFQVFFFFSFFLFFFGPSSLPLSRSTPSKSPCWRAKTSSSPPPNPPNPPVGSAPASPAWRRGVLGSRRAPCARPGAPSPPRAPRASLSLLSLCPAPPAKKKIESKCP